MPINAHPEFLQAEKEYNLAQTLEEKLKALEEMLSTMPAHKGAENLRAQLRQRYKRLKQKISNQKKSGKAKKQGIKKSDMQAIIVGFPNTGKSSVFKILTNQNVKVSQHPFTTYEPRLGTIKFEDVNIQLIDTAPFPNSEKSLINSADTLLLIADKLEQITQSREYLQNSKAKQIIIFNKTDLLTEQEKRKLSETLKSKKLDFILFSVKSKENLDELKKKIFKTFPIIRIYTKEPKKPASKEPMILKQDSTIRDVAEKILKGMAKNIARTRIWGPSSKFSSQVVGIEHTLKDKDVVEFQTK